jgi:hypothetical protein
VVRPGDALIVTGLGLSNSGISRLELYVDGALADTARSTAPSAQTSFEAPLVWPATTPGEHSFFVRAFDTVNSPADSARQVVRVEAGPPRYPEQTPLKPRSPTPRPPTRTPSPLIVLPPAPTIEIRAADGVAPLVLPQAARFMLTAHGSVELDRVEVWARQPGDSSPQLVFAESAKGATEEVFEFAWAPPRAGIVHLSARVRDNLGQSGDSPPLAFEFHAPRAPTPVPAVFDFARAWAASSPAAQYRVQFKQTGRALRGTFLETKVNGQPEGGAVVTGRVDENRVLFGVLFDDGRRTLDFDCAIDLRAPALLCNYVDENGKRGIAVFQRPC